MSPPTVKLYRGDCLQVLKRLPAGSVDAVVTDPPYGIGLTNNDRDGHRRIDPYRIIGDEDPAASLEVLEWALVHGLPTIAFASPWHPWPGEWRNLIVWDKGGAVGGGGDIERCLKRTWELIQVARNGPMNGERACSVWHYSVSPHLSRDHIAAKPLRLMIDLIERFTVPGQTVFDPFMGSGTTGVACMQTGRHFIGIEIDPQYHAIAKRRIAEARKQLATGNRQLATAK